MKTVKWYLGGSWNVIRTAAVYIMDYYKYPQHLRAKIEEVFGC